MRLSVSMIGPKSMCWEYLAGFFDGEGHVGIAKLRRKGGTFVYAINVSIVNTNLDLLKEIQREMGGQIYKSKTRNKKAHRQSYSLQFTKRQDQFCILSGMLPFLRIKRVQASLVVRLIESRNSRGVIPGNHIPYSAEEAEIIGIVRTLNKTGPSATQN